MRRIKLNWHQQRERNATATLIANIGGYGSGKSFTVFLLLWDRSKWDTGQRHGLFANTANQLKEGILGDLFALCDEFGIEYTFGRAPRAWVQEWKAKGIPYPTSGPRVPNTWIWRNGLHVICGGLENGAYKRYKGFQFGSIIHEEFVEQRTPEAFNFLFPRVRCGRVASGICKATHRHQYYARANPPPPTRPHWVRAWVKGMIAAEQVRRAKGEKPFFLYLKSSTLDNIDNVGWDYVERLKAGLDSATARAVIDGELDQFVTNRTYYEFTEENIKPVGYDPSKPLYLSFDFNNSPSVATLGQDLRDDEVPEQYRGKKLKHHGVFGEFFHVGGMSVQQLAKALLRGGPEEVKLGGHWPENFRGLTNHANRIYIHGDASAKAHTAADALSLWGKVLEVLRGDLGIKIVFDVPEANPLISDSLAVLQSKMRADNGDRSYFVDPRCTALINDFQSVVPKADGSELIDKSGEHNKLLTHISDAERYKIHRRFKAALRPRDTIDAVAAARAQTFPFPIVGRSPYR